MALATIRSKYQWVSESLRLVSSRKLPATMLPRDISPPSARSICSVDLAFQTLLLCLDSAEEGEQHKGDLAL